MKIKNKKINKYGPTVKHDPQPGHSGAVHQRTLAEKRKLMNSLLSSWIPGSCRMMWLAVLMSLFDSQVWSSWEQDGCPRSGSALVVTGVERVLKERGGRDADRVWNFYLRLVNSSGLNRAGKKWQGRLRIMEGREKGEGVLSGSQERRFRTEELHAPHRPEEYLCGVGDLDRRLTMWWRPCIWVRRAERWKVKPPGRCVGKFHSKEKWRGQVESMKSRRRVWA